MRARVCVLRSSSLNIIIQRYLAKEAEILTGLRREEQAKIKQKEREGAFSMRKRFVGNEGKGGEERR